MKVYNFVWRLLHDSLPTKLTLKRRGIPIESSCPLCNEGDESISHLFLRYTFARPVWHGSALAIHTSNLNHTSTQEWIGISLLRYKQMDQTSMHCLQAIFSTLWTIWSHRNLVIHEGKQSNLVEVILTDQSLLCWYQDAFSTCSIPSHKHTNQTRTQQSFRGPW